MNGAGAEAESGWYDDPERAGELRYWDGRQWTDHRAPRPPDRRQPRLGCFGTAAVIFGLGIITVVVLFAVFIFAIFYLPYRDAESKLRQEADRVAARSWTRIDETYAGGQCFDNCPALNRCYSVGAATGAGVLERVARSLRSHGYRTTVLDGHGTRSPTSVSGYKDHYSVHAYGPSERSCAHDPDGANGLLITFEYRS